MFIFFRLHEEINDFYEKMRPTEQEEEIRLRVVEHITRTVHSLWPLAKVCKNFVILLFFFFLCFFFLIDHNVTKST